MQYSYLYTKGHEDHHHPLQECISRILSYQDLGANMKHFELDSSYKQRKKETSTSAWRKRKLFMKIISGL